MLHIRIGHLGMETTRQWIHRVAGLPPPPRGAEFPGGRFGSLSSWTVFPALQLLDWLSIVDLEDHPLY